MAEKNKKSEDQPEVIPPTDSTENSTENPEEAADKNKTKDKKSIVVPDLDDRKEYKIIILKKVNGLKVDQEKTVSGNVARQLIKTGVAKLKSQN